MEEWRAVVGWEGFYEVSDEGRIRNAATGATRKVHVNNSGYPCVRLAHRANGSRHARSVTVHSLVAAAFLGDRPPRHDIDHVDGVKAHNGRSNLEYVTRSENHRRAYAMGLKKPAIRDMAKGERHYRTRLTDSDVLTIRRTPGLLRELAAQYGVSIDTISRIRLRKGWKHLP